MNCQNSLTDEKLIQFYLNGDSNAISILVELYKDRIYKSVYSIVQDRYTAEEIFRQVFDQLINNLMAGNSPEEGNFLQWAIKIANGLCLEHTAKSNNTVVLNTNHCHKETLPLSAIAGSDAGSYHESHGKIKSMINMLPDEQREVIILNHYAGMSFKEIAETMQCSMNNALNTMRFGLANLQKMMTEKEILLR
jgi:RNA polymerase sigma factor (sigma-70 family)